jgi:phosphatidylserine/phosphatidylglycerophosphate/cardiolipin synthase-like enzyme
VSDLRVVSNTGEDNLSELKRLISGKTDRLVMASPYLAPDIETLLHEFSFHEIKVFELITTFKPKDAEQFTKPFILKDLFEHFSKNYPKTKLQVHVDNQLHGKIYIATKSHSREMIVSSANFTRNGLSNNHEWGLATNNDEIIDNVITDLFESIEYQDVTYTQIKKACLFADQYIRDHPEWEKKPDIYSDILDSVYSVEDESNTNPQYFLKPIGVSESPILLEDKRDFSNLHENLHFSKKQPKGVRKGDVLITVAVTAGSLLSYYKVTGGLQEATQEEIARDHWKERWPWYMEGRNLSPQFGGQWWIHNIQRKDALNEFLETHPGIPVTSAGGFSLGTLNYGGDKVKITKEFGDFLISKIEGGTSVKSA